MVTQSGQKNVKLVTSQNFNFFTSSHPMTHAKFRQYFSARTSEFAKERGNTE